MRRLRWFALLWLAAAVLVVGCKSQAPEDESGNGTGEAAEAGAGSGCSANPAGQPCRKRKRRVAAGR